MNPSASIGWPRPITGCTKLWSITGGTAGKPTTRATNCGRLANIAGLHIIGGGTKTSTAGIGIVTGMMSTVTRTPTEHPYDKKSIPRERSDSCCALLFSLWRRRQKKVAVAVSWGAATFPPRECSMSRTPSSGFQPGRAPQEDVMQLHTHLKSRFAKAALAAAALGGFLFFVGAPGAAARDHDDYRRPAARYDDSRLREAREDHGFYSPQANYWRHERNE